MTEQPAGQGQKSGHERSFGPAGRRDESASSDAEPALRSAGSLRAPERRAELANDEDRLVTLADSGFFVTDRRGDTYGAETDGFFFARVRGAAFRGSQQDTP